ncbi:S8 family serine peptidase [Candidatus Poriferisocius sp.]|uniref:S8 family serine peptidase n=1 Tax=Candidatus Poriferisocius sp. TaxID=3101276 RepID=UPI003B015526
MGLVLALLGGVLNGALAEGAEPGPHPPAAQFESAFATGGDSVVVGAEAPPPEGGEFSAGDGLEGEGGELGAGDGLAPEDGLDGPGLGEAVAELGVLDLVGPDGVWTMDDGGRGVPLRLLDESEVAELGDARSLAASTAATAYAPGAAGNASGASASGAGSAANPGTWFVSDTGQPHLLVGGVNVLFGSHMAGPAIDAVWDRHGVAPGQVSPLGQLPNGFLVKTVSDAESLRLADALSAEPGVDTAVPNTFTPFSSGSLGPFPSGAELTADAERRCNASPDLWADELSSCQWHLDASGDFRFYRHRETLKVSDPSIDINLGDVWSTTMGAGVTVAVVDTTWNRAHEDLVDNVDSARSQYWCGYTGQRIRNSHGTSVAGVVGARDNTVGGRGVAPRATLVNYNFMDCISSANAVAAKTLNMETVAVSNHSYGMHRRGLAPRDRLWQAALETSLEQGFGGKGTSHVQAAGNGGISDWQWASLDAANNYRGVISACAVNSAGSLAYYSEKGPSLWVCAPTSDRGQAGILAPIGEDGDDHYTAHFGGTSAAAPIVSGVIALMRSVNANLTWRDVKVILADTAQKNDPEHSSWLSGAQKYSSTGPEADPYSFSHSYGFGLVDAKAAVDAASGWTLLPPMRTATASHTGDVALPARGEEIELALGVSSAIDFTEHVKVAVAGDVSNIRDYRVTLVSPSGAESILSVPTNWCDAGKCSLRGSFDFGSSRHLGENPEGTWKLRIRNEPNRPNCAGGPAALFNPYYPNLDLQARYKRYCDDSYREVISAWSIEVTGHSTAPSEPVTLSVSAPSASEGGSVDVTVSVGGPAPTEDLVVPLVLTGVTAETGVDFSAPASITVPKGSSSATAQISITQDTVHEGPETFKVGLGSLPRTHHSSSKPVVVTIDDDDPPPVMTLLAAASVAEGGSVDVTAQLSSVSSTDVTANLFAAAVAPAVAGDGSLLGSPAVLTIPAGSTASSGSVVFTASQNDEYEVAGSTAKTFEVSASAASVGHGVADPAPITIRIDDDESAPVVSMAAGPAVSEGSTAEFTFTADPVPSADLAVSVMVAQGGAFGVVVGARTVTIPASGRAVLAVMTTDDSTAEPDGSVTVTVVAGADYTPSASASASVAVFDDESPRPRVSITAGDAVSEGSAAEFTLTADPVPLADLAVSVEVYQQGSFGVVEGNRMVTIPASGRVVLLVATTGDSFGEPDGSVTVTVFDGLAYDIDASATATVGADGDLAASATVEEAAATVAVADDDGGPVPVAVSLSAADASVSENGGATDVEIALSRALRAGETVSVPITVSGVPGSDWLLGDPAGPGVVRTGYGKATAVEFSAGGRTAVMRFEAIDDDAEFDRPITFAFGTGTRAVTHVGVAGGLTVGGPVTITIADNDLPPVCDGRPTVSVADATAVRGEDLEFHITLSCRSSRAVVAHYYIGRGSEIDGSTRSVTFGPGDTHATVSVPTKDSDKVKFQVAYAPGAANALSVPAATGTVTDTSTADTASEDSVPVVSIAPGADITEGASASFTVTAVPAPASPLTVTVDIAQTGDFAASTQQRTVVLSGGTATFSVPTRDDSIDEADGSITATLVDGAGYDLGTSSTATVSVADDDDPPPVVTIAAGADITEGHKASFTVTMVPVPASPVAVSVSVSAVGDFGATTGARTVTVPTQGSATFAVATSNDAIVEADGSVKATLADGPGYDVGTSSTATVSVADDDDPPPQVDITASSGGTEGTDVVFTFTATPQPAANLDVAVEITASGDFGVTAGMRTAVILSGTTQATLNIATADDGDDEPDGSVTATLTAGTGYTVGPLASQTVQVLDDDDPPLVIPEISIAAAGGVTEGADAVFTVTATPAAAVQVAVTVTAAGDYGATAGARTVNVPAGGSATLTIATAGDSTDEADGSVTAALDAPGADAGYEVSASQGEATVAVSDDDVDPLTVYMIFFARSIAEDGAGDDNQAHLRIAPTRALRSWETLTVPLSVTGGDEGTHWTMRDLNDPDAVFANEFEVRFGPGVDGVVLEPGDQRAELVLTAVADSDWVDQEITVSYGTGSRAPTLNGSTEGVTLGISWGPDGVERADGSTTVVIIDSDEPPPQVDITAAVGGIEGTDAVFTITASAPTTADLDVSVDIASTGDWGATTGARTATIPSGATEAILTVATVDDGADEPDGSISATLVAGSGYTIGQQASRAAPIADDDDPPPVIPVISITSAGAITEGAAAAFTVTADPAAATQVAVTVTATGDYGATTGPRTIDIPAGGTATFTVATTGDGVDEADGSVTATLDAPAADAGYTVSPTQNTATAAVADDDPPPEPEIADCAGKPTVTVADATAQQDEDLQFVISLSCRSTGDVTVYYAVAHDRRLGSVITITIKGGETGATVNVPTAGIDADIEFHIVYLIGAANYTAQAKATITP